MKVVYISRFPFFLSKAKPWSSTQEGCVLESEYRGQIVKIKMPRISPVTHIEWVNKNKRDYPIYVKIPKGKKFSFIWEITDGVLTARLKQMFKSNLSYSCHIEIWAGKEKVSKNTFPITPIQDSLTIEDYSECLAKQSLYQINGQIQHKLGVMSPIPFAISDIIQNTVKTIEYFEEPKDLRTTKCKKKKGKGRNQQQKLKIRNEFSKVIEKEAVNF